MFFVAFEGALVAIGLLIVLAIVRPPLRNACGRAARCGLALGTMTFLLGYFGPLLLNWGGNQGPLLGIFVTGPAGFVIGAVIGFLYETSRR